MLVFTSRWLIQTQFPQFLQSYPAKERRTLRNRQSVISRPRSCSWTQQPLRLKRTIQQFGNATPQARYHGAFRSRRRPSRMPRHKSMTALNINLDIAVSVFGDGWTLENTHKWSVMSLLRHSGIGFIRFRLTCVPLLRSLVFCIFQMNFLSIWVPFFSVIAGPNPRVNIPPKG